MKNRSIVGRILAGGLLWCLCLSSCAAQSGDGTSLPEEERFPMVAELPSAEAALPVDQAVRGVWVSYLEFDHMLCGKNEAGYRKEIQAMLEECEAQKINTLLVQVRSHGDAYYPSDYYPWSVHASGSVGKSCGFDPLAVLLELAREKGMAVHAWINPYRLMQDAEMEQVPERYAIRQWYQDDDYMVKGSDGYWYLNAGNTEVQDLIVQGVEELIQSYEIDGVQIDDYFYDKVKPRAFGDTNQEGRQQVTELVKRLYDTIKAENPALQFGVSPAGNFQGSDPASDSSQLTDLSLWCTEEGYLDYVAPQIYWEFDHEDAPFLEVLEQWETLVEGSPVKLYVGLAAYKFAGTDILEEEMQTVLEREIPQGYFLFRYDNLV